MKDYKYINSGGLAFSELEDMKRLSEYAKDGWLLERFQFFGYQLKRGQPENIEYALDYRKLPNEEYFACFEEAGWTHVCSGGNEIHIFQAAAGTTPIHTDSMTLMEKYKIERKSMGKIAFPTLIVTFLLILFSMLSENGILSPIFGSVSILLGFGSLIVLIFTGMPYIGYTFKLRKLRKYHI